MLPFLKKDKEAAVAVPVEAVKRDHDEDYSGLHAAADDIITAIHAKDTPALVSALKAAFELFELQPHEEGPHDAA